MDNQPTRQQLDARIARLQLANLLLEIRLGEALVELDLTRQQYRELLDEIVLARKLETEEATK